MSGSINSRRRRVTAILIVSTIMLAAHTLRMGLLGSSMGGAADAVLEGMEELERVDASGLPIRPSMAVLEGMEDGAAHVKGAGDARTPPTAGMLEVPSTAGAVTLLSTQYLSTLSSQPPQPTHKTLLLSNPPLPPSIPQVIHQIWWQSTNLAQIPAPWKYWVKTWTDKNPGYLHHLLDGEGASKFVETCFSERVREAYERLPMMVQRTDFLRYALLYIHGGLYADVDTILLRPLSAWHLHLPSTLDLSTINIIMGKEWNRRENQDVEHSFLNRMSIGTWTLLAAPRHELFGMLLTELVGKIEQATGTRLASVDSVVELCGPSFFTTILESYLLSRHNTTLDSISTPSKPDEDELPRVGENKDHVVGDMLIMGVTR
ncbi:membrane-bound alpha-1,6- mannosyltransferase Initiation-specific, partial [Irineochytrium annulatum]